MTNIQTVEIEAENGSFYVSVNGTRWARFTEQGDAAALRDSLIAEAAEKQTQTIK